MEEERYGRKKQKRKKETKMAEVGKQERKRNK